MDAQTRPFRFFGSERSYFSGNPYRLWMVQRPLDAYRALDAGACAAVDRAVAGTGCEQILAYAPRHRLDKRGFKLVGRRVQPCAEARPA